MYQDEVLVKLKEFEGDVAWMYLDSVGNVTCGVGILLPTAERACQLPFHLASDPQVANTEEITAEWRRVKAMAPNRLPGFYRITTSLELEQPDIDALCVGHIRQNETELRGLFAGYDGFPEGVKKALLDMCFNLGIGNLTREYPNFRAAVMAQDWPRAAAECGRRGIAAGRNDWTESQFNEAASTPAIGG